MQQSLLFLTYEYDGNGKVNSSAGFIGNINPFRWKGFYYDVESGLYYANGSYYDPLTGLYVDSAPIDGVMENALSNNLDRNGLMCNNILELACNPSTIFNVTELTADPTYDVTDKFPDWMKREIKRQEKINKILRWYQDLHWGWKLGVGIALLIGAICFTVATGGGGAGVISVLVQTAIGVGVGVGLYTVGSLMSESFTVEGLADAALNAFLITSATVFISSAVNYIKQLCRSRPVNTAELVEKTSNVENVAVKDLNHTNGVTRKRSKFNELVEDIRANGIQEPIKYVEINNGKYIVDGNHRVFAAKLLKMKTVPGLKVSLPYNGFNTIDDVIWDNIMFISGR